MPSLGGALPAVCAGPGSRDMPRRQPAHAMGPAWAPSTYPIVLQAGFPLCHNP